MSEQPFSSEEAGRSRLKTPQEFWTELARDPTDPLTAVKRHHSWRQAYLTRQGEEAFAAVEPHITELCAVPLPAGYRSAELAPAAHPYLVYPDMPALAADLRGFFAPFDEANEWVPDWLKLSQTPNLLRPEDPRFYFGVLRDLNPSEDQAEIGRVITELKRAVESEAILGGSLGRSYAESNAVDGYSDGCGFELCADEPTGGLRLRIFNRRAGGPHYTTRQLANYFGRQLQSESDLIMTYRPTPPQEAPQLDRPQRVAMPLESVGSDLAALLEQPEDRVRMELRQLAADFSTSARLGPYIVTLADFPLASEPWRHEGDRLVARQQVFAHEGKPTYRLPRLTLRIGGQLSPRLAAVRLNDATRSDRTQPHGMRVSADGYVTSLDG